MTFKAANALDNEANFIELFDHYFEVISADTPEKLRACYRLRYEVYCEEGVIPGFSPEDYPEGLEIDDYDQRSAHSLLLHKPSGRIAGTVRVILPDPERPEALFPLEKFAGDSFYADVAALENLPRRHLGEISRLILAPQFRGRRGENRNPYGVSQEVEPSLPQQDRREQAEGLTRVERWENAKRRMFPHTILGLLVAVAQISIRYKIAYLYMGMEPSCARLLQSFGVCFAPISPVIDYYGPCRSYLGSIEEIEANTHQNHLQIWKLLTRDGALYPV